MRTSTLHNLQKKIQELEGQSAVLAHVNKTLKARLLQSEDERRKLEEQVLADFDKPVATHHIPGSKDTALNIDFKLPPNDPNAGPHERMAAPDKPTGTEFSRLSPTETRVATLVRQGCSTKEIATRMDVAARTVDMHRFNIRCKLGLGRRGMNLQAFLTSLSKKGVPQP